MAAFAQVKAMDRNNPVKKNNLVHKLLKKNRTRIDIGGNVGEYSAELRRRNPNVEDTRIEPSSLTLKS